MTLRTLLASLPEGASVDEILADFPTVSREALRAVIAFAAASAEEDLPVCAVPVLLRRRRLGANSQPEPCS